MTYRIGTVAVSGTFLSCGDSEFRQTGFLARVVRVTQKSGPR